MELSAGRQEGFSGPQPVQWREMAEWASLTNCRPSSDEWRVLRAMDRTFCAVCREQTAREQQSSSNPHIISERTMSPELWDAIF